MNPIAKPLRSKIGFADLYLERYGSGSIAGLPHPDRELRLIITIPAYKEPDLGESVRSLLACDPPGINWEIIVNVNFPEDSDQSVVAICRHSFEEVWQISQELTRTDVRIICLWSPNLPGKHAGVGMARKIAMDQAVFRFNSIGRPDGVIVSFDADSICDRNFLKCISELYTRKDNVRTANIRFEHALAGNLDQTHYHSIAQYELYLRYMRQAIRLTGHPHNMHTVGSSFSVRCKTYIRVNGMGSHKAGEDFYFLHKCIQLKGFWEINDTAVYPSSRISDRVSFGTGASIGRMQQENSLLVYHPMSFNPLQDFFARSADYWIENEGTTDSFEELAQSSPGLYNFLISRNAEWHISEMRKNSAGKESFQKKFFAWFNGFMILAYLNSVHQNEFEKIPVGMAAGIVAVQIGIQPVESVEKMLAKFREYERNKGNYKII